MSFAGPWDYNGDQQSIPGLTQFMDRDGQLHRYLYGVWVLPKRKVDRRLAERNDA